MRWGAENFNSADSGVRNLGEQRWGERLINEAIGG
jgi:hypothetical protein